MTKVWDKKPSFYARVFYVSNVMKLSMISVAIMKFFS
jgi:hypothetical protein